ncbi:MAG: SpoIIE family protein phosphatase [Thermoflexibacter sp.]|nr:SpoIIE family protein phosphatase [Thermoflexibacter sp.]
MNENYIKRIYVFAGILSWAVLALLILADHFFEMYHYQLTVPLFIKALLLNIFAISIYLFIEKKEELKEGSGFYELLWSVFFIGLVCTAFSIILTSVMQSLSEAQTRAAILWLHLLYLLELAMMMIFLMIAFIRWKKLILYHQSKLTRTVWKIFEYGIFLSLILHFFDNKQVPSAISQFLEIVFFSFSLILSINLSWIAFLSLRQKFISLVLLIGLIFFLAYFYQLLKDYPALRTISVNLSNSVFFSSITVFVGVYSIFSILVLLFNMPTSSVFEKKFNELSDFHRLIEGKTAHQVYNTMLEIATRNLKSDAAWLDLSEQKEIICTQIEKELAHLVKKSIEESGYNHENYRKFNPDSLPNLPLDFEYRSVLAVPLTSRSKHLATLVLLKKENNAFDNVATNLISTYAAQASIALDNFRLISETVENERYKTELLTAKKVQQRLLSKLAFQSEKIELLATSLSPEEVGGDFYDFHQIAEGKYALIIGDVSGKGTVAAFNMAQMKGIFHALVQLDLPPDLFLKYANEALSRCLEKNAFITAIYIVIDTKMNKINYVRAGHCPPLYLESSDNDIKYIHSKGLGLGIMRNKNYKNFINVENLNFKKGDILFLYTDGVIEAKKNDTGEEFGYERLRKFLAINQHTHLEHIANNLVKEIYQFTNDNHLKDDCTILLIKFY